MTWEKTSEALFIHNYIKELGALRTGGRCTIRSYTIKACCDGAASLAVTGRGRDRLRCSVLVTPVRVRPV